jgi:hypothetical protein
MDVASSPAASCSAASGPAASGPAASPADEEAKPPTKEEEIAENIRQALRLGDDLFTLVKDPLFCQSITDPKQRYQHLCGKYKTFAQAFPVCLRFLACDIRYNHRAFERFLEKQRVDPGKGMDGFINRQADYARFLYEEETRRRRGHISVKMAGRIWQEEYKHLSHWMKDIQKKEELGKNEYEQEHEEHTVQRKKELLSFLELVAPSQPASAEAGLTAEQLEEIRQIEAGLPADAKPEVKPEVAPVPAPSPPEPEIAENIQEIDIETISGDELVQLVQGLRDYEKQLSAYLRVADERIALMEKNAQNTEHYRTMMGYDELEKVDRELAELDQNQPDDWLTGTAADRSPKVVKKQVAKVTRAPAIPKAKRVADQDEVDRLLRELSMEKGIVAKHPTMKGVAPKSVKTSVRVAKVPVKVTKVPVKVQVKVTKASKPSAYP